MSYTRPGGELAAPQTRDGAVPARRDALRPVCFLELEDALEGAGDGVLVPSHAEVFHACPFELFCDAGVAAGCAVVAWAGDADERGRSADAETHGHAHPAADGLVGLNDGAGALEVELLLDSGLAGRRCFCSSSGAWGEGAGIAFFGAAAI